MITALPVFPGEMRKNDALFMSGATKPLPWVYTYLQDCIEIVHGPSCKKPQEIHLDRCFRDAIDVQERRGGGGTVVLSPGMVVIIAVGERPKTGTPTDIFKTIHDSLIALLSQAGITTIVQQGISDCAIDGRKIMGSSLYLGNRPQLYYYQSSLMVESDPALIERYLKHPPREPDYRKNRPHADFCTTLRGQGFPADSAGIAALFQARLPELLRKQRLR